MVDHLEGRISVLALDSGRQLWSLPEETRTTVVVDEAIVAVDKDDTITVFDIADGTERFQHDISGHFGDTVDVTATAIVAAEQSESSDEKRTLFALSTETGDRLWERELANPPEDETTIAAPVGELQVDSPGARVVTPRLRSAVDSPVVYLTSEGSGSPDSTVAVDVETGDELWTVSEPLEAKTTLTADGSVVEWPSSAVPGNGEPLLHEDTAVQVRTVDVETGDSARTLTHVAMPYEDGTWQYGNLYHGPYIADSTLLGMTSDHKPTVADLTTGDTTWTATESGEPLYLASGVALYWAWPSDEPEPVIAHDITTDEKLWTTTELGDVNTVVGDRLVSSTRASSQGIDLRTGEVEWIYSDGQILAHGSGYLVFLQPADGEGDPVLRVARMPE